jgi:carboxypeptidase C (cathepsin A)
MRTTIEPGFDEGMLHQYYSELGVQAQPAYWSGDDRTAGAARPGGANWVWNYRWPESAKWGHDYAEPWLPHAMKINPRLPIFVAAGQYDAANSCAENDVLLSMLDTELARNYSMNCYLGGHMMYRDPDVRRTLSADLRDFITHAAAR